MDDMERSWILLRKIFFFFILKYFWNQFFLTPCNKFFSSVFRSLIWFVLPLRIVGMHIAMLVYLPNAFFNDSLLFIHHLHTTPLISLAAVAKTLQLRLRCRQLALSRVMVTSKSTWHHQKRYQMVCRHLLVIWQNRLSLICHQNSLIECFILMMHLCKALFSSF